MDELVKLITPHVISQYIDKKGKVRMIKFKSGECLMTPPIYSLYVPEMSASDIQYVTLDKALKFIEKFEMSIESQTIYDNNLVGLWLKIPPLSYTYLPIKKTTKSLQDIPITQETLLPPLILSSHNSLMDDYIYKKHVATYLKEYAIYIASQMIDESTKSISNETLEDMFIILPDHLYDIYRLDKKLYNNDIMIKNNKLIVTSKNMKKRLIYYIKYIFSNHYDSFIDKKNKKMIENYYNSIIDFKQSPNTHIFNNYNDIQKWLESKQSVVYNNYIRKELDFSSFIEKKFPPKKRNKNQQLDKFNQIVEKYNQEKQKMQIQELIEPHFYFIPSIHTSPFIIQHVYNNPTDVENKKMNLKRAISVAYEWYKSRVNKGYNYTVDSVDVSSYRLYQMDGSFEIIGDSHDTPINILDSPFGYAAMLMFY